MSTSKLLIEKSLSNSFQCSREDIKIVWLTALKIQCKTNQAES